MSRRERLRWARGKEKDKQKRREDGGGGKEEKRRDIKKRGGKASSSCVGFQPYDNGHIRVALVEERVEEGGRGPL